MSDEVVSSSLSSSLLLSSCCCFCMEPTEDKCGECNIQCCNIHNNKHRFGGFCQPWRILKKPGVGRIMVAARNILAWERVLYDEALVIVPDDVPVCLGCLDKVTGEFSCERCLWPMCGKEECLTSVNHEAECKVFAGKHLQPEIKDFSSRHWAYTALAILRVILTSSTSTENAESLELFMDHREDLKSNSKVWEGLSKICKFLQVKLEQPEISLDQVQHVFGALKTNAICYKGKDGRVLFPLISKASHSCAANLESTWDPSEKALFRAKVNISEGEEVTIRYTNNLTSKFLLQRKLREDWLFDCICSRCSDSTEFATFFSSSKCECGGFLCKVLKDETKEKLCCNKCDLELDLASQLKSESEILQTISNLQSQEKLLDLEENLLKTKYHDKHYLLFNLRTRFLDIVDIKNIEDLKQVSRYSKYVIDVLQVIDPGCTKIFGRYLSLMLEAEMRILTDAKKSSKIEDTEFRMRMKQVIQGRLRAAKLQSNFVK